jgi:hypothetical protein
MQTIQRIIRLDVFHFHFGVELDNCKYDFLTGDHKLRYDGCINLIKITLKIDNAEIIVMKGNSGY